MKAANTLNYILGAGTFFDYKVCGVVPGHAYSVISAFELTDSSGNIDAELYMVRNPWGSVSHSNGLWSDVQCNNTDNGAVDSYSDSCELYN
jgi:hypothetical protein